MNAVLRLDVFDNKPQRIDGYKDFKLSENGWLERFEYRIKVPGNPSDGTAHVVEIVNGYLVNAHSTTVPMDLEFWPQYVRDDAETEIAQELDEEQV